MSICYMSIWLAWISLIKDDTNGMNLVKQKAKLPLILDGY